VRGLIVVFGGLPEVRLGEVASGGVNDYAQLWLVLGGSIRVCAQSRFIANFS
jgi:hypothetical protein